MLLFKRTKKAVFLNNDTIDLIGTVLPELTNVEHAKAVICLAEYFAHCPEEKVPGLYIVNVKDYRFTDRITYHVYRKKTL